jgi:hypothetical protein
LFSISRLCKRSWCVSDSTRYLVAQLAVLFTRSGEYIRTFHLMLTMHMVMVQAP